MYVGILTQHVFGQHPAWVSLPLCGQVNSHVSRSPPTTHLCSPLVILKSTEGQTLRSCMSPCDVVKQTWLVSQITLVEHTISSAQYLPYWHICQFTLRHPVPFSYFSLVCHCQGSTWSQPFVEPSHLLVWIPHIFMVTGSV